MVYDNEAKSWIAPFVMAGINTKIVRRSNALSNFHYGKDFTYEEAMIAGKGLKGLIKAAISVLPLAIVSINPNSFVKKFIDYFMPKPGEGPGIKNREQGFYNLRFFIKLKDNSMALAKVIGDRDPGYGSTSKILAESALCLAFDDLPSNYGIITPSYSMGDKLLKRLRENAGLSFELIF